MNFAPSRSPNFTIALVTRRIFRLQCLLGSFINYTRKKLQYILYIFFYILFMISI